MNQRSAATDVRLPLNECAFVYGLWREAVAGAARAVIRVVAQPYT